MLQQAAAQKYLKEHTPTDAEMRAEFEAQIASAPLIEYQARHILVSSEDVAMKVIEQLKAGNDFASWPRRLSSDAASAAKGGDLGWFAPRDMDQAFTNAVAALKKGEFTKTPVQTAVRLARDPAAEHARSRAAGVRRSEGSPGARSWWPRSSRLHSDEMLKTAKIDPPLTTMKACTAPLRPLAPAPAPARSAN